MTDAQKTRGVPAAITDSPSQAVMSLAVLAVNWDAGKDAIDSFVKPVAECMRQCGGDPISLPRLQAELRAEAGIKIPSGALETIVRRCAKLGYARKSHGVWEPVPEKLAELDYAAVRAEALRRHEAVLKKLCEFANSNYDLDWDRDRADEALLTFLERGSIPVLAAAIEGDPVPPPRRQSRRAVHVVAAFVGQLAHSDPDGFQSVASVVKGYILSGVLFYPDLGTVDARLDGLDVYCDTPFLLPALGYAEEGRTAYSVDLIELLAELGVGLRCFHHTREEVVGVLEAEVARLRSGYDLGAVDYATSRIFAASEIEEMIAKIDVRLGDLGIEVVDTPAWAARPDEAALCEFLKRRINYQRERAREKDASSLAATARLRGMRKADKLENARAIFVTTNTTLAKVSSKFFTKIEGPGAVPVCMSVETLTRIAWVRKPLSRPDLPAHRLIAASYAALNPPLPLWREYLNEIRRRHQSGTLSDDDYFLLRTAQEARQALMDKTVGVDKAFAAGTVDEVLAHARQAIRAEAEHRATEAEAERADAEGALAAERERRESAKRRHLARVAARADRDAGRIAAAVSVLVALVLAIGLIGTIPGFPIAATEGIARIAVWACIAVFLGLSGYAVLVRDVSVNELRRRLAAEIAARMRERGVLEVEEIHGERPS